MSISTRDFLILDRGDGLSVYRPSEFPPGTPVGRDARVLRTRGPGLASSPSREMTAEEFGAWVERLGHDGYDTKIEPFWTSQSAEDPGPAHPLHEVFDELLRLAHERS